MVIRTRQFESTTVSACSVRSRHEGAPPSGTEPAPAPPPGALPPTEAPPIGAPPVAPLVALAPPAPTAGPLEALGPPLVPAPEVVVDPPDPERVLSLEPGEHEAMTATIARPETLIATR